MAVDGWAVTFDTARKGLGGAAARPSTASVPVTVLLYNGPLLYSLIVPIKGLTVSVLYPTTGYNAISPLTGSTHRFLCDPSSYEAALHIASLASVSPSRICNSLRNSQAQNRRKGCPYQV